MIGIIITCFVLLFGLVFYLNIKLIDQESSIRSKFKNAWWVMVNQDQQNKKAANPNSPQITQEQSNCIVDNMISTYGLTDSVIAVGFSPIIGGLIMQAQMKGLTPLQATTDFMNNINKIASAKPCDAGKKCGIPSNFFNGIDSSGAPVVNCNY